VAIRRFAEARVCACARDDPPAADAVLVASDTLCPLSRAVCAGERLPSAQPRLVTIAEPHELGVRDLRDAAIPDRARVGRDGHGRGEDCEGREHTAAASLGGRRSAPAAML
jgi:hypothetical protein